jgi:hypothetical protein
MTSTTRLRRGTPDFEASGLVSGFHTEAVAVYRKLDASSRSEAIQRAIEVGLMDSTIYPPPANFTLDV